MRSGSANADEISQNFALRNRSSSTKRNGRKISSEISGYNGEEEHAIEECKNKLSNKALQPMNRNANGNQMDRISKWNRKDVSSSESNQMDQKKICENNWTVVSYGKRR